MHRIAEQWTRGRSQGEGGFIVANSREGRGHLTCQRGGELMGTCSGTHFRSFRVFTKYQKFLTAYRY